MRLLIAVESCQDHLERGFHNEIRNTWGKDAKSLGIDVRFFVGDSFKKHEADEIFLDCPDDYHSLPKKTQSICQWAVGKSIDYVYKVDTDTFVIPRKLLMCGFQSYDYVGKIDKPLGETFPYRAVNRDGIIEVHQSCFPWASGGYGYFLSRKAFTKIADVNPTGWAEDLQVGQILGPLYLTGEISMLSISGGEISSHFPSHVYNSGYDLKFNWMQNMYTEHR
jgi:hypothetical protein